MLDNDVEVPLGPPGAMVASLTYGYTDLRTFGFRAEATKLAFDRVMLTYGVDMFRDRSDNTDSSVTTVTGFGPPTVETSNRPTVPNAWFQSAGAFVQGDVQLARRVSVILGGRYQDVRAATRPTPGLSDSLIHQADQTVVGTANLLYEPTERVSLFATVGRAFRSPNLVERFYNGLTPEGAAYQVPNPALGPETSLNVDLGARFRSRLAYLEAYVFRNEIHNGIRIAPTGDSLNGLPTYWDINVDKLRYTGVELSGDFALPIGPYARGSFTHLLARDVLDQNNPIGDSYASKIEVAAGYRDPGGRFWLEYSVRHNGNQRDAQLSGPIGTSPIGDYLPAFTVHDVRAEITVIRTGAHAQRLGVAVTNLTDALYAEFANASFFRPEPRRSLLVSWDMSF